MFKAPSANQSVTEMGLMGGEGVGQATSSVATDGQVEKELSFSEMIA